MLRAIVLALALAGLAGCQTIYVKSAPAGADVFVDGEPVGKTPCKFKAKSWVWLDYDVEIRKEGFKPYKENVDVELGPNAQFMLVVNLILCPPIALLVPFFGDCVPHVVVTALEPDDGRPSPQPQDGGLIPSVK